MKDHWRIESIDARSPQLQGALELVRAVFMEFEAPEYSQEGIEEFCALSTAPKY